MNFPVYVYIKCIKLVTALEFFSFSSPWKSLFITCPYRKLLFIDRFLDDFRNLVEVSTDYSLSDWLTSHRGDFPGSSIFVTLSTTSLHWIDDSHLKMSNVNKLNWTFLMGTYLQSEWRLRQQPKEIRPPRRCNKLTCSCFVAIHGYLLSRRAFGSWKVKID